VALHRSPEPTHGVDVSVAPTIGAGVDVSWIGSANGQANDGTGFQAALPVMVGINFPSSRLIITPEVMYQHTLLPAGILDVGGTIAFRWLGASGLPFYPALAIWKALDARHVVGSLGAPGALAIQPALVIDLGR
jgi:hypothetical protein